MMGNIIMISFKFYALMASNLSINWSSPSYFLISSTSLCVPQWVLSLWLFFAISAKNFDGAQEVGRRGEHCTYYEVPLPNYLNLASLQLLLTIITCEAKVVGEGNQNVWATCLIQCPSIL